MAKVKRNGLGPSTQVETHILLDGEISIEARAIYSLICCAQQNGQLPKITVSAVRLLSGAGVQKTTRCLRELSSKRYIAWPVQAKSTANQQGKPGYVYLFKNEWTGLCKVGSSQNIEARRKSIQSASGGKIEVIASHEVADMGAAEDYWHESFSEYRVHGEWFSLSDYQAEHFSLWNGGVA